jgi:hypothetical protein
MDIAKFLGLALELETEISKLYEVIAEFSGDAPIAAQLRVLASTELNHANIIRRGISFYEEVPGLFAGIKIDPIEAAAGLEEARTLRISIEQESIRVVDALRKLLEMEKKFEKIHMAASVIFTDVSMQTLFGNLAKSDKSHIMTLKALIEGYGGIA